MVRVKVCGVTRVEDAEQCIAGGVDALGINFAPASPRCCTIEQAQAIVRAVGDQVLTVGVFVDASFEEIRRVQQETGIACVQLHGDEPPELLARLLPHAYKALRVRGSGVVEQAQRYPGDYLLLDAYVPGAHGGTGARFDWQLALEVARTRRLVLAGGLTPDNVAEAVDLVHPWCVDVASGVEEAPGVKDPTKVARFVEAARSAAARS